MQYSRALAAVGVIVSLSAGCLGGDEAPVAQPPADEQRPACPLAGGVFLEPARPCVVVLDPGSDADREVSLAAHPIEADTLLASWSEATEGGWTVWIAHTTDAGATWRLTNSRDVVDEATPLPVGVHHFDTVSAFAPDGAAVVLFGESRSVSEANLFVARSQDNGESWTLSRVPHNLGVFLWDAMDLAVAPDTGAYHVVAQSVSARGVWIWTSTDAGASWTPPFPLHALLPDGFTYWPRVAAYPDGLVVVTAKGLQGLYVIVSRDGGVFFDPGQAIFVGTGYGAWVGDMGALGGDGSRIDVVAFGADGGLARSESADGGATWSAPEPITEGPASARYVWSVAAQGADGALHVLATFGSADNGAEEWGAELATVAPDGSIRLTPLAGPVGKLPPRGTGAGDEYGGVAVAADGLVWWAFSDPRDGEPRVSVGHMWT